MALPELVQLYAKQGDHHQWKITATEDDETTPIDFTGWTWEFSASKDRPYKGVYFTYTEADDQIDTSEQDQGIIYIQLLPEDSRLFGKEETVEFELTGTAPNTNGESRLSIVDGQINLRLEVANES